MGNVLAPYSGFNLQGGYPQGTEPETYGTIEGALASYDFAAGDTLSTPNENGFVWENSHNLIIDTSPQGKLALRFNYEAGLADSSGSWKEIRYAMGGEYPETYEKFRLYLPANYAHRFLLSVTIGAADDTSTWVKGDTVTGATGSTSTFHSRIDDVIYLLNADKYGVDGEWKNVLITNTTRSQSYTTSTRAFSAANNKFSVHWEGEYSSNALVVEYDPMSYIDNTLTASSQFLTKTTVTDSHPVGSSFYSDDNTDRYVNEGGVDLDKEYTYVIRRKRATTAIANDGLVQIWRDGVLVYERLGIELFDSANNFFENGYLLGWCNSSFDVETIMYISLYEFWGGNAPSTLL